MHMADALLSPPVAAAMYAASGAAACACVKVLRKDENTVKLPAMAVASALVFAGQMVNYAIPGTGSSGHLCGGMMLSALLGPQAGFLSMTAVYFVLKEINLTQNLFGLILVFTASSAMQYYICKGFFDTIPKSLDEAARIDGASRHTIFVKIILPLAKPIIIYTVLTAFIAPWGEYMFSSFIMLGDPDKFTVAVGMKSWLDNSTLASEYFTVFCAAAVVVSIPITALFIWLQRYYVEGITGGSVKG